MDNLIVGKVIAIKGRYVEILMNSNSNSLTYFYEGKNYNGATIGEYLGIVRGPFKIVGIINNEFLKDKFKDSKDQSFENDRMERIIELSIVGYFYKNKFYFGTKYSPMIYNEVSLLDDEEKEKIINQSLNINSNDIEPSKIRLGKSLVERVNVDLPINGLFNSHIGIFGNTGSGKSNTLAKIYYEIFHNNEIKPLNSSKFVFIDFNGEYIKDETICDSKTIYNLTTREESKDKIKLAYKTFWNEEILSILFSAREKTQKPFIKRMLKRYLIDENSYKNLNSIVKKAVVDAFKKVFKNASNKDSLTELKRVYNLIWETPDESKTFSNANYNSSTSNIFVRSQDNLRYFSQGTSKNGLVAKPLRDDEVSAFKTLLTDDTLDNLNFIDKLIILLDCLLINDLTYNEVVYEHIKPLINRVEANKSFLSKTIELCEEENNNQGVIVYSFKNCNLDAKKILPLLISKELYDKQVCMFDKDNININKTCHLIIDEAHNILSEESIREAESFKDYRLEVFEQIIKEGRKFGFYLTIASQRPHDISPTLTSQINNYFIHRLVNDLDLRMLSNSISFLDNISKELIPTLNPGECILTGQLVKLPIIVCVDKLKEENAPKSENVNLDELWRN